MWAKREGGFGGPAATCPASVSIVCLKHMHHFPACRRCHSTTRQFMRRREHESSNVAYPRSSSLRPSSLRRAHGGTTFRCRDCLRTTLAATAQAGILQLRRSSQRSSHNFPCLPGHARRHLSRWPLATCAPRAGVCKRRPALAIANLRPSTRLS